MANHDRNTASNEKMNNKEKKKRKVRRKMYLISTTDSDDSDNSAREADEKWKLAAFHREQLRVFELCRKLRSRHDETHIIQDYESKSPSSTADENCSTDQLQEKVTYDEIMDNENTVSNRGFVNYAEYRFPYIVMNGYKFISINDAVKLFALCIKSCRIPWSFLQKHRSLQRTFCSWEQVYMFEITDGNERKISTGTMLIRVDTLLNMLPRLKSEIKEKHRNTPLKKSKICQYEWTDEGAH